MERIEQLPLFDDLISFVNNVMPYIATIAEVKVLIYICEHACFTPTLIPLDEFVKITGLSEASILRGLRSAQAHGLIRVIVDETDRGRIKKYYCLRQANDPILSTISRHRKHPQLRAKAGYVYLLQSISGHYKIGRTQDPERRVKTFAIQLPFEVEYVCLIETLNMVELEKDLHLRFAAKRLNGEWFDLDAEEVEYIKGLVT